MLVSTQIRSIIRDLKRRCLGVESRRTVAHSSSGIDMDNTLRFASFRFEAIAGRMGLALGVPVNPASVDRQPNVSQSGYRVTIGMPLYNNAGTIRRALDSLLAQSFTDFHLLISDDRSTDETPAICAEYARCDPRVEIVHQPRNLNYGNFRYVLNAATTPLFMFAAG